MLVQMPAPVADPSYSEENQPPRFFNIFKAEFAQYSTPDPWDQVGLPEVA